MTEKDDLENQGSDLDLLQRQFPLELSSGQLDKVPSPGIVRARLRQSNHAINVIITAILVSFAYSISAT